MPIGTVDRVDKASICSVTAWCRFRPPSRRRASGNHQARQDRRKFRVMDRTTTVATALSALNRANRCSFAGQHHPGENRGQADNRQGVVTDFNDLSQKKPRIERRPKYGLAIPAKTASRPVAARKLIKTRPIAASDPIKFRFPYSVLCIVSPKM